MRTMRSASPQVLPARGPTKREEADAILGGGCDVKLETAEYDWTLNGEY